MHDVHQPTYFLSRRESAFRADGVAVVEKSIPTQLVVVNDKPEISVSEDWRRFDAMMMSSFYTAVLAHLLIILGCGSIHGFALINTQGAKDMQSSQNCYRQSSKLYLQLGEYSVELESPLGMILEERGEGDDSGVKVLEVLKDEETAGSAWKSQRVAPGEILLDIDGSDVSKSSFDNVMDILTTPSTNSFRTITLGDGLGQFDMPKNVVQRLETTEDAFFVDAVVREAVRAIRRDGRLGDLLNVEVIVGAGVTTEKNTVRGMVRFFAIFSTDGVTTYSCNVSATGVRSSSDETSIDEKDPNKDIEIISLSCAKDEGLGRTYDLI